MNYPIWDIPGVGYSLLMVVISVPHVFAAHFAVGAGLFLVMAEKKGYREKNDSIIDYVRSHSRFFLLLSMVYGAVSGVGIWFLISLIHPAATSALIHTFVFGWAAEWVFFVVEIAALFVYFYAFDRMSPRNHMIVGWIYLFAAWMSLFIINGIITFMLTPGQWPQDHSFWSGFFNPTMWQSLFFRTSVAFMLTGLFGFVTAVRIKDEKTRVMMTRYCAKWVLVPLLFTSLAAYLYFMAIPSSAREMILGKSPEMSLYVNMFIIAFPLILAGAVLMMLRLPLMLTRGLTVILLVSGFMYFGGFEWMREAARRPYVIPGLLYSSSIYVDQEEKINKAGILQTAKWVQYKKIDSSNRMKAGREIFRIQCQSCHTVGGLLNDIVPRTRKFSYFGMKSMINGLGKMNTYMPRFMGTQKERDALAAYIVGELQQKGLEEKTFDQPKSTKQEPADFDMEKDDYVLLAWNDLGMHCVSDCDPWFVLLPPANTIWAQLIKRGASPSLVTHDVELSYSPEAGFEHPEKHSRFWKYSKQLVGKQLQPGIGAAGKGISGTLEYSHEHGAYVAEFIPVMPYPDSGGFNPFPVFSITAKDKKTGKVLAKTKIVIPTSTEMSCYKCHGGSFSKVEGTGVSDETAMDILAVHDRIEGTDLLTQAKHGHPYMCSACHADAAVGSKGKEGVLNLSAAIHGWHANILVGMGPEACGNCHPSNADASTQCFRGRHKKIGLNCTDCHGALEDHAAGLLAFEASIGNKKKVDRLTAHLKTRSLHSFKDAPPRQPWVNEPDCMSCHEGYKKPKTRRAFGIWTKSGNELYRNRKDLAGLSCPACHNSPHAIFPTSNPLEKNRDNLPMLQYQHAVGTMGTNGRCKVCHRVDKQHPIHHPNIPGKDHMDTTE